MKIDADEKELRPSSAVSGSLPVVASASELAMSASVCAWSECHHVVPQNWHSALDWGSRLRIDDDFQRKGRRRAAIRLGDGG